jgi:hypothetical protein
VLEYYFVLRSVLRTKLKLRSCLARCAGCRIFFLTDPRNRGREDLRCPFGCRECHCRQSSAERSRDYYRTPAGKEKKKALNKQRRNRPPAAPPAEPASLGRPGEQKRGVGGTPIGLGVALLRYLCVVVSLIEGRKVTRDEVCELIRRVVRQHSLARERRIDYVLRTLKEKPT